MRSAIETGEWIDVTGTLSVLADDLPFAVEFCGDTIEVAFPNLATALALRRRFAAGRRRVLAHRIQSILARAGLEIRFLVGSRLVARLAANSQPAWASHWLGIDPVELRIAAIVATILRPATRATRAQSIEPADPSSRTSRSP